MVLKMSMYHFVISDILYFLWVEISFFRLTGKIGWK